MAKILKRTQFGNPVLREPAKRLTRSEILSSETQELIADMRHTVDVKKYGVGLAAPQVGVPIALSIVGIKQTPSRPDAQSIEMVIINPEIVKTYGSRSQKWEGCISFGGGTNFPYAKALRWSRVRVKYLDEFANEHERDFDGLLAHVMQHETDHLNGILFVERVKDPRTFVMVSEYKRYILPKERKLQKRTAVKKLF
jgi:peptide deformylase